MQLQISKHQRQGSESGSWTVRGARVLADFWFGAVFGGATEAEAEAQARAFMSALAQGGTVLADFMKGVEQ